MNFDNLMSKPWYFLVQVIGLVVLVNLFVLKPIMDRGERIEARKSYAECMQGLSGTDLANAKIRPGEYGNAATGHRQSCEKLLNDPDKYMY